MLYYIKHPVAIILIFNFLVLYTLYLHIATIFSVTSTKRQKNTVFPLDKKIFFVETEGNINSRQACSVESAARSNPDWAVNVLFFSLQPPPFLNSPALITLNSFPNIFLKHKNLSNFVKGTRAASLFTENTLKNRVAAVLHPSDILRILVLQRYGGVYLDLDMIVMRSFNDLPENFVAKEVSYEFTNGVLGVSRDPLGRVFVDTLLREMVLCAKSPIAKSTEWKDFGVMGILRTMIALCGTTHVESMSTEICKGFEIFNSEYFYPIPYERWRQYYDRTPAVEWEEELLEAFTHHTWGALSANTAVHKESLLVRLAKRHCPSVYAYYGNNFVSCILPSMRPRLATSEQRNAHVLDPTQPYKEPNIVVHLGGFAIAVSWHNTQKDAAARPLVYYNPLDV